MSGADLCLALTTSTRRGGVAVLDGDRLLAELPYDGEASHAERALPAIQEVLALAGVERWDLRRLACDVGPGSFTGVRAGVALVAGIALALGLPAVGVGSLEALAAAACAEGRAPLAVALLDARRGELFAAVYEASGHEVVAPRLLSVADAGAFVAAHPGALCVSDVPALVGAGACSAFPSAPWFGRLALRRATRGDGAPLEPAYVRDADAKTMAEQRALRSGASPLIA